FSRRGPCGTLYLGKPSCRPGRLQRTGSALALSNDDRNPPAARVVASPAKELLTLLVRQVVKKQPGPGATVCHRADHLTAVGGRRHSGPAKALPTRTVAVGQKHPTTLPLDGGRPGPGDDQLDGVPRPYTAEMEVPPGRVTLRGHRAVDAPAFEAPDAVRS